MKVLITGGAGFIGSHVADLLIESGYDVVVLDSLVHGGKKDNIPNEAAFYRVDITDGRALERVFKREKPQAVIHLAAQINIRKSIEDPLADARTNILASLNLIHLAAKYPVGKFIFFSTGGAMHADTAPTPTDETVPADPKCPYAIAKRAVEHYLNFFGTKYGLNFVILRCANVYGPRQNPDGEAGVISIFLTHMLEGNTPVIHGDGSQTRDFVYVADVARAAKEALERPTESRLYHIGTGRETSIQYIFDSLNGYLKHPCVPMYTKGEVGKERSALDITRAAKELRWKPRVSLDQGLRETYLWYRDKASRRSRKSLLSACAFFSLKLGRSFSSFL